MSDAEAQAFRVGTCQSDSRFGPSGRRRSGVFRVLIGIVPA